MKAKEPAIHKSLKKMNYGTDNYDYYYETILPDEVKEIQVDEFGDRKDNKLGLSGPEWACNDIPDSIEVSNTSFTKFSHSALTGVTICEPEYSQRSEPFQILEGSVICDTGYTRVTEGY